MCLILRSLECFVNVDQAQIKPSLLFGEQIFQSGSGLRALLKDVLPALLIGNLQEFLLLCGAGMEYQFSHQDEKGDREESEGGPKHRHFGVQARSLRSLAMTKKIYQRVSLGKKYLKKYLSSFSIH